MKQVIRENLNPCQVLSIVDRERKEGNYVDVNRISPALVEIIIRPLVVIQMPASQPSITMRATA